MDTLIIQATKDADRGKPANTVRVSKKALTLVNVLCASTGRTQKEIASMLIEWAYDRCEVVGDDAE